MISLQYMFYALWVVQVISISSRIRLVKWIFVPLILYVFLRLTRKAFTVLWATVGKITQVYTSVCKYSGIVITDIVPFDIWSDLWFCLSQTVGCGFCPVMLNKMLQFVWVFFSNVTFWHLPLFSPLKSHQHAI